MEPVSTTDVGAEVGTAVPAQNAVPSTKTDVMTMVLVGEITAPFGVRGEIKMMPLLDQPQILPKLPTVRFHFPGGKNKKPTPDVERKILKARRHQHVVLLTVENINNIDEAETLRDAQVFIGRDQLPPLAPDTYYEGDLLGLSVRTDAGADLGKIERVLFLPANDVYETPLAMIPAIGSVVLEVDLEQGMMLIHDIPGLRKNDE